MGEWMHRFTFSWRGHYFGVSGQLHAQAALPLGERAHGSHWIEKDGWAPEPVCTTWREENYWPYRDSNSSLCRPGRDSSSCTLPLRSTAFDRYEYQESSWGLTGVQLVRLTASLESVSRLFRKCGSPGITSLWAPVACYRVDWTCLHSAQDTLLMSIFPHAYSCLLYVIWKSDQIQGSMWIFVTGLFFYGVRLLDPRSTSKLEAHSLSAVCGCLFNVLAATFHRWRPSTPSANWGCAMSWWQGAHITWGPSNINEVVGQSTTQKLLVSELTNYMELNTNRVTTRC
jgi:hypothetical protein